MSLDISLKTYRHTNSIFLFSLFSLQKLPCLLIETTAAFTLYNVILNSSNQQTGNPTIFLFLYLAVTLSSWLTFAYMVVAFTALLWYVWLWRAYCIYAFRHVCLAEVQNDFILDKKLNKDLLVFMLPFLQKSLCFIKNKGVSESIRVTS